MPAAAWAFVKRHVLTLYSALFFAYLMLPIVVVAVFSFNNPPGKFNYTWYGFTWDNWRYWNGVPGIQSAIVLSLEIALVASLIATERTGERWVAPPLTTAFGALLGHITGGHLSADGTREGPSSEPRS